jgi:hypothetical protein
MRLHGGQAAARLDPVEHQPGDVDRVGRRGVQHRVVVGLLLVVESRGCAGQRLAEQVLADDHDRQPGGSDVLLRAAIDQPIPCDIDRPRQDAARHVRDQRNAADIGREMVFDPADSLVRADMHIGCIGVELPVGARRHAAEIAGFGAGRDVDLAVFLGFLDRFLRPFASVDVVGAGLAAQQVHWHHSVFGHAPALQEQHLVVGRDGHQLAQQRFGLRMDRNEFLAAMAHLHHRHAAAMPVKHLVSGLAQHGFGQGGRAGAEIEHSGHHRELRQGLELAQRAAFAPGQP